MKGLESFPVVKRLSILSILSIWEWAKRSSQIPETGFKPYYLVSKVFANHKKNSFKLQSLSDSTVRVTKYDLPLPGRFQDGNLL
jgi:hypothetical protein